MDLGTWIYQMEMEPRITTPCMCGEGCRTCGGGVVKTVATASHAQKCALTWQARSPQGLQKYTAMIWSILTSMQEIYLSMVSWLLRHVCVMCHVGPMGWEIGAQEICPPVLGVYSG